jgi:hypothetical protein
VNCLTDFLRDVASLEKKVTDAYLKEPPKPPKPPSAVIHSYSASFPEFASLPGTADLERARTWNRVIASLKMKGNHA